MSEDAERFVADVSAVPVEFWIALVVLSLLGGLLAWATERAPYDPYADRSQLDVWDQPTCGALDTDTFCRRPANHAADYHSDGFGRKWIVEDAA